MAARRLRQCRSHRIHKQSTRPPHTAHDLPSTKICYRCHPFYGTEVEVIRHLRTTDSAILIIRLPSGVQVAVPDWMLNPQVCDRFTYEAEPRISIDALFDLRRLIDAHHLGKHPRSIVVQNLHQEVRMHSNESPSKWQRKLRFEDEEIWTVLPASVREQCLTLWRICSQAFSRPTKGGRMSEKIK